METPNKPPTEKFCVVIKEGLFKDSTDFYPADGYTLSGAHHLEPSTPILGLCHGVFTEQFIFRLYFRGK